MSRLTTSLLAVLAALVVAPPAPAALPDPKGFTSRVDNPWFPLPRGADWRSAGVTETKLATGRTRVLPRTKLIAGVACTVVLDTAALNGTPEERTVDYYAQDRNGNVWYFGEDSFDFDKGRWERSHGSWRAGVDGAEPGIIMRADPRAGDRYTQEHYVGHAEDKARVLGYVDSLTVTYGTFRHVLVTEETSPLEPGVRERKFYAHGVGLLRSVITVGDLEFSDLVAAGRGGKG
jgi:hypothetical protein